MRKSYNTTKNKSKFIIKEYFNEFSKLTNNNNIKIVDKHDYYMIYFLDKIFFDENIDAIDKIYNKLSEKFKKYLYKDIMYGYFYDFYVDKDDFNNDIKNGLCEDLTFKFIDKYYNSVFKNILNLEYKLFYKSLKEDTSFNEVIKISANEVNINYDYEKLEVNHGYSEAA